VLAACLETPILGLVQQGEICLLNSQGSRKRSIPAPDAVTYPKVEQLPFSGQKCTEEQLDKKMQKTRTRSLLGNTSQSEFLNLRLLPKLPNTAAQQRNRSANRQPSMKWEQPQTQTITTTPIVNCKELNRETS
jgi:hypothetical protein